jgi:hypothetical protein
MVGEKPWEERHEENFAFRLSLKWSPFSSEPSPAADKLLHCSERRDGWIPQGHGCILQPLPQGMNQKLYYRQQLLSDRGRDKVTKWAFATSGFSGCI